MILDALKNWRQYAWGNQRFDAGFEYLERLDPDIADGSYELEGRDLFVLIQSYETKPKAGRQFEAHRDYADIQMLFQGRESILWTPREDLTVTKPYEPDVEFYALTTEITELVLVPGLFGVFLPEDAHAPCITYGSPCSVRKAVIKVKL